MSRGISFARAIVKRKITISLLERALAMFILYCTHRYQQQLGPASNLQKCAARVLAQQSSRDQTACGNLEKLQEVEVRRQRARPLTCKPGNVPVLDLRLGEELNN